MCDHGSRSEDGMGVEEPGRLRCHEVAREGIEKLEGKLIVEGSMEENTTARNSDAMDESPYESEPEHSYDEPESWHYLPTGRPVAEPPMFNYDKFIDENVPSEKRMLLLFPERRDIESKTALRDHITEDELLFMLWEWSGDMLPGSEGEDQAKFYEGLRWEIGNDNAEVRQELAVYWDKAPAQGDLRRWEFFSLDQDLGTKGLERQMEEGWVSLFVNCREAWHKYRHLAPEWYDPYFRDDHKDKPIEFKTEKWPQEAHQSLQENMRVHIPNQQHWTKGCSWNVGLRLGGQAQRLSSSEGAGKREDAQQIDF